MASTCVVCLAADVGGLRACACRSLIHPSCLAELLQHHFKRCRVCLQPYSEESQLTASRSSLSRPGIFRPLMDLCAAATNAGRSDEASAILAMLPASLLGEVDLAQFLFERGRVLALRNRFAAAENNFQHAVGLLRRHVEGHVEPLAMSLMSLAATQLELNALNNAAGTLHAVILLTPRLPADMAEAAMRVIGRYCLARGDVRQHAKALKTINDIVHEESSCPVRRAAAYLEMRLAEAAAYDVAVDTNPNAFQASLRILRQTQSSPALVHAASRLLGSQCPPKKRRRVKTHPEEADA